MTDSPTDAPTDAPAESAADPASPPAVAFAALRCLSNFSFLRGASHPEELVLRARELGHAALALTDECSLAGVVRAHVAAREAGLKLLVGSQFRVNLDARHDAVLVLLARRRADYAALCRFITQLRRASPKGRYRLRLQDLPSRPAGDSLGVLCLPRRADDTALREWLDAMRERLGESLWLGVELHRDLDDPRWLQRLQALSRDTGVGLVACPDVQMHLPSRQPLHDTLCAIRLGRPLAQCGLQLQPNAERALLHARQLLRRYPRELLERSAWLARQCQFSLDELRYNYPREVVPQGLDADTYLRRRVHEGAWRRWRDGPDAAMRELIEHELALIRELGYAHYFLTVDDIVSFARARGILCQGRGSAANSVVCWCLGVTEVDPSRMQVLFERFISRERREPPDIDVDFEHERREEVIQYLYARYGRERAALTASVVGYRARSAIRDVGKALGFEPEVVERLARNVHWWDGREIAAERLREVGLDPAELRVRQWMALVRQLLGFPRHLSQHTGGFVLTGDALHELVPIENAAMPGRTVIEWDKDDLDAMGMLKVDVLALGMLTALRKSLQAISRTRGAGFAMQDIPAEDPATYDMLCAADSVGVFQVESRAQQSMLPRLRPRCFYDLVVEVAIVRPGPIQGGMVHPYLRRRQGLEPVHYPGPQLRRALERTLGVPVFQEQVMQISMLAAGFSAGQADGLRRAMAAWRRKGSLQVWRERLVGGMVERGYDPAFAEQIFAQVQGFSEYGFPESHAASFALLVYASAWIKRHHPAEFLLAMLNSQPMGFYTPSQLVQDARRHGVRVLPPDVQAGAWDCALEDGAVRLGLRLVRGLGREAARRIEAARAAGAFADVEELALRAALGGADMRLLAAADALRGLAGNRRQQVWQAAAVHALPPLLRTAAPREPQLPLAPPSEGEDVVFDYAAIGLSLRRHPLELLRGRLHPRWLQASQLARLADGSRARACGLVTLRQQPETARGTTFVSLEDETGVVQVICWKSLRERQRQVLLHARLLAVAGRWQSDGSVGSLLAERLFDLTPLLGRLQLEVRDFH